MNHDHQDHHNTPKSHGHHEHMIADFRKRFIFSMAATVPVLLLSPLIQKLLRLENILQFPGYAYILFAISSFIFLYGGWPFLKGAVKEIKSRNPGMMTLVALAITIGHIYSSVVVFGLAGEFFFWEIATLIDVMLLGHWIEMKSVAGASRALEELARLMPKDAHKLTDEGSIEDVPLEELEKGDRVIVKPGEKLPADGVIVEGSTSVNESMLTGESKPVYRQKKDRVIGGSINQEGSVTIEVSRTGADTYLSGVIRLVEEAQQSKSRTQDIAGRAAFWLTIAAISLGAFTFFVWFVLVNRDFAFSLERTVTVMVITCPHALGLAVPLVVAVSTSLSAKNGLLIRDRAAFEKARNINAIIFDKTGTLTEGEFGVTDIAVFSDNFSETDLLRYAASLESLSSHPIAKAIADKTEERLQVSEFRYIAGKGATGVIEGKKIEIISPNYLKEKSINLKDRRLDELYSQGKTIVFVLIDNRLSGAIALADKIRVESGKAISSLKEMDIKPIMLTGDNSQVAMWVAGEVGIEEYFAQVLPEEKSKMVKEVQARGMVVAMTGDGVNDAPALAQADVGIAIGAGTDVAVETADIILVRSNPSDVVSILSLSRATYRKMIQNLMWATGYNILAIPLAAGILYPFGIVLSPAIGAALMSLSTIIVAINARFLRVLKQTERMAVM
ncbi:MAG: copper-translocating P-type ATPase [Actinobacteria bacterium]|nr:copper-translocating P-type ATPase [Actinomycetota bacterium]